MQLDAMQLFCDVADEGSVSRAAQSHGITQSAASQRLQGLEKSLGCRLMDRSHRPLTLTTAGRRYHLGCRRILASYQRLTHRVTALNGRHRPQPLRGEVTVAAIYSAGINLLAHIKSDFEAAQPNVTVTIQYLQPQAVHEQVRRGACDLGILSYPRRWRDLASIPLQDEIMAVVCRGGHPLATRSRVEARTLGHWEMVSFDRALPIARHLSQYLRRCGVKPNLVGEFDNIDTIKAAVAETQALAILPQRTVQREVQQGTLAALELAPRLARPMGIVHLRQNPLSPLVRAFADYLVKHQLPAQAAIPALAGSP